MVKRNYNCRGTFVMIARSNPARGHEPAVFVRAEGDLEFRDVAEVIDLARGVGVYRVALM
jgi:biopolymer transport protein ExbD